MTITTMQVFRSLGIAPDPTVSWSVGARVAAMYRSEFGSEPPKENRPKTSGAGTHCFAIYPTSWQQRIAQVIRSVSDSASRQDDLFGIVE